MENTDKIHFNPDIHAHILASWRFKHGKHMMHSVQTSNTNQHQTVSQLAGGMHASRDNQQSHNPTSKQQGSFSCALQICDAVIKLHEFCAGPFEMTFQNL